MKVFKPLLKYTLVALAILFLAGWVVPHLIFTGIVALGWILTNPLQALVISVLGTLTLTYLDRKRK